MTLETNILDIPVLKVVQALNIPTREHGDKVWIKCPFTHHEHDDESPACEVGGNKNLVRCFKCGIAKDNLGLTMQVLGLEARDAANWLRTEFGIPGPTDKAYKPVDPINMLASLRNWSIHAFELIDCRSDKDCVIFPMRDGDGNVVGIKKRKGNNTMFQWYNKSVKSYTPRGNKHGLFYPKELPAEGPVLVLEGEADTLAAISAGANSVIGTAGSSAGPIGDAALQKLLANREAILFPDPRASGRKWLNTLGELLLNVQCKVKYVPADKKDLDEKLRHEKDLRKKLKELLDKAVDFVPVDPETDFKLPKIVMNDYLLDSLTRQAINALDEKNDPPCIFVRMGRLTRVLRDEDGHISVDIYSKASMRLRLAECARFVYISEEGEHFKSPPDAVVESVLVCGSWPFPPLRAITGAPILRDDGSICLEPGYDEATAMYYVPPDDFKMEAIPSEPSEEDVAVARELLLDVIRDFPFADKSGPANSLSLLFTMLMRSVIDGYVPLCIVDAPSQGTGKGKLVKSLSIIALGDELASQSAPHGRYAEEEWRKLLIAILDQGSPAVLFDNISEREVLDSAPLASILTTDRYTGRVLGQSKNLEFKVNLTWVATGNNVKVTGDMPRRCYSVRLDSNLEKPWERDPNSFLHPNLERYVRENRYELLRAAFVIIRAWYAAGKPAAKDIPVIGSFVEWSEVVGGVLQNAGIEGFLSNQKKLSNYQDDEWLQWRAFFNAWNLDLGESSVSTADVVSQIFTEGTELSEVVPDVLLSAKERGEASLKRSLGRRLSRLTGKIFNSRKLDFAQDLRAKTKLWVLSEVKEDSAGLRGYEKSCGVMENGITPPTDGVTEGSKPQDIVDFHGSAGLRGYDVCMQRMGTSSYPDDDDKNLRDGAAIANLIPQYRNPAESAENPTQTPGKTSSKSEKRLADPASNPATPQKPPSKDKNGKIPIILTDPASNPATPQDSDADGVESDKDVDSEP